MSLKDITTIEFFKSIIPNHVHWKINNVDYGSIENNHNTVFEFNYTCGLNSIASDLETEIKNGIIRLYENSNNPLAICVGGADSEIIARKAAELGIPAELYFLDLWNINSKSRIKTENISKEIGLKLNVISLTKEKAFNDVIPKNYVKLQSAKPTYLCLPYLLELIPDSMFIVGGEGDPQKSGPSYEYLADSNGKFNGLPISLTEVWYRQWSIENNKKSEMYFYSSTPELISAYYNHPLLTNNNRAINTRQVVDTLFPQLTYKYKTTNWEDVDKANYEIREYVRKMNPHLRQQPHVFLMRNL